MSADTKKPIQLAAGRRKLGGLLLAHALAEGRPGPVSHDAVLALAVRHVIGREEAAARAEDRVVPGLRGGVVAGDARDGRGVAVGALELGIDATNAFGPAALLGVPGTAAGKPAAQA
jgi:hypothetical protein